jgi:hypothetical protein
MEGVLLIGVCCLQIPLEVIVAELIRWLVVSVVRTRLLDIASEVNERVKLF